MTAPNPPTELHQAVVSELFGLLLEPSSWCQARCSGVSAAGRGRRGSPAPGQGQKGHFPKGWTKAIPDAGGRRLQTRNDNTVKRQHMASGGQVTQPPFDGREASTVQ